MNEAMAGGGSNPLVDMAAQDRAKTDFIEFIDPRDGADEDKTYAHKIDEMLAKGETRLIVDITHLRNRKAHLAKGLVENPREVLPALEAGLKQYIQGHLGGQKVKSTAEWKVGIEGAFGNNQVTPRDLLSNFLGKTVCVEGIVTKAGLVLPKVVESVHYCEVTTKFQTAQYRDNTSLTGLPTGSSYPRMDVEGNRLETEFGLCTYLDTQTVFIQDMPERTEAGTMPRSVQCLLEGDLVDACKPGDRVQMIGLYRSLQGKAQGEVSGKANPVVLVNNIRKLGIDEKVHAISREDLENIKEVAKRKDVFHMMARSIAPSIFGHEFIKKAIVLQLLGGVEKNLENGTHIRGDINILMVGDPSCAKSQLLRSVMKIAPLAINTTGRGSSGVGLTAAVLQDRDTGERRLEAGAMVLADRGIVCIDEFDKMTDQDRTAIHEVMEQQTVTIAKAGIHTTLNARCSVIAASNPVYGQYDRTKKPHENIALPDSLLSRFDLLFIVLDKLDAKLDRAISAHVLDMHRYRHKETSDEFEEDDMEEEVRATQVYEKKEKLLKGAAGAMRKDSGKAIEDYLTVDFCKKFIHYAKKSRKPRLTNAAAEMIAQKYAQLRDSPSTQSLPITARCLESLIRFSSAHAKCRLANKISKYDVVEASKVLQFALTNDVEGIDDTQEAYGGGADEDMDDAEVDMEDADEKAPEAEKKAVRSRRRKKVSGEDDDEEMAPAKVARPAPRAAAGGGKDRSGTLTTFLNKHFRTTRADSIKSTELLQKLKAADGSWTQNEVDQIVDSLHIANKVFVHQGEIHQL